MLIQKYVRELYCKHILENAIGKNFTKIRPLWLTMGTSRLELDMYNQELNLALEHNGEQNVYQMLPSAVEVPFEIGTPPAMIPSFIAQALRIRG